jgi:endonuclease YncB( thermonuclease family)
VARAYAMDGATFYQSGRKIRVQGLDARDPGMSSEHATQRLQRALDAGSVTVEPVEVDGSGHTVAVVRVNGRNVADAVRASTN